MHLVISRKIINPLKKFFTPDVQFGSFFVVKIKFVIYIVGVFIFWRMI